MYSPSSLLILECECGHKEVYGAAPKTSSWFLWSLAECFGYPLFSWKALTHLQTLANYFLSCSENVETKKPEQNRDHLTSKFKAHQLQQAGCWGKATHLLWRWTPCIILFELHFFKLYYHSASGLASVCRQVFHANYRWLLQAAGDQNNHQQVFAATANSKPPANTQQPVEECTFFPRHWRFPWGSGSVNSSVWPKPYKFSVIIFGCTLTNSSLFTHKRLF